MTPLEEQLQSLAQQYPGTTSSRIADGSCVITVPDVELPAGWNAKTTTIRFVAPVGYPNSKPDCFWTDPHLKVSGSPNPPQNTGPNPLPNSPGPLLWFSWHTQRWSPNFDSLLTYFRVIKNRLLQLR
jgi:hypothetical protein